MTNILITLAVGTTLAIGTVACPTAAEARWHHHGFPVAPLIGGLAAGAILGAATLRSLRVRPYLFRTAVRYPAGAHLG
jgi:hypothetical protein